MRETTSLSVRALVAATLVLVLSGSFPIGSAELRGIDVTVGPSQTKAAQLVNFTITLQNNGDQDATIYRIDIKYGWEADAQNVFTGSRVIASKGNGSWIHGENIPALAPGSYRATVTVNASNLIPPTPSSDDWIVPIEIIRNVPPTAEFTYAPTTPAPDAIVSFTDNSTDPDGVVREWFWDFGDLSNSNSRNPTHPFASAGSFAVVLVVTDNDGDVDTVSHTVQVLSNRPPLAAFSYTPMDTNTSASVQFSDGSSDPDGLVVQWRWEFGDGTSSNEQSPLHQYQEVKTYQVVLTVTDNDGATNSVTQLVVIVGVPFRNGDPKPTGFGALEWGLVGSMVAGISVVAVVLIKRRLRPSRQWGRAQSQQPEPDSGKRWRPR